MPRAMRRHKHHRSEPEATETPSSSGRVDRFAQRHELVIILSLCILASIRVFVFSAAFPPFGNVDEAPHYSLVCDYAEGHIPIGLEPFNSSAADVLGRHSSPEYMISQDDAAAGFMRPPLDEMPAREAEILANQTTMTFMSLRNGESTGPPVYYAVAAGWYKLGETFGLADVRLAYWIRFLNVAVYGLLVWTAYVFLRRLYPGDPLVRVGVPLMLAFFPQDVFYQINSDVLSPLLFTIALYTLLRVYPEGNRSYSLHLIAGLSVAAVFLVKFSNAAIFVPLGIITVAVLSRARAGRELRAAVPRLGLMLAAAFVPIGLWLLRNHVVLGDAMGSRDKVDLLGWVWKPLGGILNHPVFTPAGAWHFVSELTASFWRGEMVWHMVRIAMPVAEMFYVLSSLLFVAAAVAALRWQRERLSAEERYAGWMGAVVVTISVAMMLALSLVFDFGLCQYPSAEEPYLVSGRLISGVMVPFLVLYVTGLDFLMARVRLKVSRLAVLLVIAILITASEIALSLPVFASPFNWFHLS